MRTLLFSDTVYDPNGVSRFIQDMAAMAQERGDDFKAITSTKKSFVHSRSDNIINIAPLFALTMPFYRELDVTFPSYFKIKKEFLCFDPDIVNIATPGIIGWIGLCLAKKYNKKVVGTYHTDFSAYMYENLQSISVKKISQSYLRYFYKDFTSVFTRSRKYLAHMVNEIQIDEKKIIILPPAIDTLKFAPEFKERTIWQKYGLDERPKLLYVGRLTVEKNIKFLVEVYKKIRGVDFIFIGEGSLSKYIEKELPNAKLLGLKSSEELSTLYASSDIFVFPSTTETLGQVVMEAKASGIATIVSNKGGQLDFCTDYDTYILPIEVEAWRQAIELLLQNRAKREEITQRGYKSVLEISLDMLYNRFTLQV